MFVPKSIVCLREGYTRDSLMRDVIAGVVVGIVALPLALAFAIASGVPPERGLYTAIVAGFLISALGGRMRHVPAIDATGIHALEQMAKKCRAQGTTLILTEIRQQPLRGIVRAHKLELFGRGIWRRRWILLWSVHGRSRRVSRAEQNGQ